MTELERSHAELRGALILAGKEIRRLNFGRKKVPVLKDARAVAKAERDKVRVKLG